MKLAVIGANTRLGQRLVLDAEAAGIAVTSVVADAMALVGSGPVLIKSCAELTAQDLRRFHVVIDALSFPYRLNYAADNLPLWHLCDLLSGSDKMLLAVGSCSFLYSDSTRRHYVYSESGIPDDPESYRMRLCMETFERLKERREVRWSVFCPPLVLDPDAYGTGRFELANDVLPMSLDGSSFITLHDFSLALTEQLKRGLPLHRCASARAP